MSLARGCLPPAAALPARTPAYTPPLFIKHSDSFCSLFHLFFPQNIPSSLRMHKLPHILLLLRLSMVYAHPEFSYSKSLPAASSEYPDNGLSASGSRAAGMINTIPAAALFLSRNSKTISDICINKFCTCIIRIFSLFVSFLSKFCASASVSLLFVFYDSFSIFLAARKSTFLFCSFLQQIIINI